MMWYSLDWLSGSTEVRVCSSTWSGGTYLCFGQSCAVPNNLCFIGIFFTSRPFSVIFCPLRVPTL